MCPQLLSLAAAATEAEAALKAAGNSAMLVIRVTPQGGVVMAVVDISTEGITWETTVGLGLSAAGGLGAAVRGLKVADNGADAINLARRVDNLPTHASNRAIVIVGNSFDSNGILPRNGSRSILNQGPHPTCGPTCVGMILNDLVPERTTSGIAGYSGVTAKGIACDKLAPLLSQNGVPARFEQTLTIDALRQATANGDPAIVAIRVSGGGHAIIVDGITTRLGREVVAIRNPWGEQYFQTLEEFTKVFLRQGVLTGKLR